jgi:hypothetical protein
MALPAFITVEFPRDFNAVGGNKVTVIKALRWISYQGLKEAKDLSEMQGPQQVPVNLRDPYAPIVNEEDYLEDQCRILRNNGCKVGPAVHVILQSLRDLAAEALKQGDDDLANEIMQLVLAEKLRRKP